MPDDVTESSKIRMGVYIVAGTSVLLLIRRWWKMGNTCTKDQEKTDKFQVTWGVTCRVLLFGPA